MTDDGITEWVEANSAKLEERATTFREAGQAFAWVTVVRREPPVSANVGDRALVTGDGTVYGWVGGAECAQSVAVEEAVGAIESGEPTLVGLAPDPETVERPGVTAYPMTCHSGGTLELFIEPVTTGSDVVVVGSTPVAWAVARGAAGTGFAVTVVGEESGARPDDVSESVDVVDVADVEAVVDGVDAVIVASMGAYDDRGVAAALTAGVSYVGLVASDPRRDEVASSVAATLGMAVDDVVAAVTTPAGIEIGAETPSEIAVSVVAELIAIRRGVKTVDEPAVQFEREELRDSREEEDGFIDPVCGMTVTPESAAASLTHAGETYYFCSEGCAAAFDEDTVESES